jgi:plastocyanin
MIIRRRLPLLAAAAWALLPIPSPAVAAPRTHVIVIDKMKFGPIPQDVRIGDVIVWNNRDMFRHSATAKGRFDVDLPAGKAVKMRVTATGRFPFLCKYHPSMTGVLKVVK